VSSRRRFLGPLSGGNKRVSEIVFKTNLQHDAVRRTNDATARLLVAACVWLLIAAGCDLPGKPNPADQPTPPEKVVKFSALYTENCAGCHGATGAFGPAPPLNSRLFRAIVGQSDLERVINEGRKDTPMPAFARENGGTLSPAQIKVLVYEIKGTPYKIVDDPKSAEPTVEEASRAGGDGAITPAWAISDSPPAGAPPYRLPDDAKPPRTAADFERIRKTTFARACAGCHGDRGQGAEKAGAIDDPALLALVSKQCLQRIVITGRADLGMPDYAGMSGRSPDFHSLDGGEVSELVDLLGYWRQRGAPTGGNAPQPAILNSAQGSRSPIEKGDRNERSS
jgi:cytochrome c oxidase cbb3-type subunit 3